MLTYLSSLRVGMTVCNNCNLILPLVNNLVSIILVAKYPIAICPCTKVRKSP